MKRMKVFLVEDGFPSIEMDPSTDLDSNQFRMRLRMDFAEIGWAEVEQMADGRLELKMTLVGTYVVGDGLAPDLTEYRGTIPTSLRKE